MDATRLGHAGPLPASLLEQAAAGCLPGTPPADRENGPDGAFATGREGATETGLAWACAGGDGGVAGLAAVPAGEGAGYRLAGALDQHGRQARQDQAGAAALWHALIAHAAGARTGLLDTTRLGQAARDRGLYRYAAALWTAAVSRGSADAAARLVSLLHETGHEDAGRAAGWAAGLVRLNDPWEAARLLDAMRAAGTGDAIRALVARDPAGRADLGARWDALRLLVALGAAGAGDAAEALGARLAERARLDDVPYLAALLRALGTARAGGAVRALLARDPARHADPDDPQETALLVTAMHAAGPEASDATRALADWAAGHCVIDGAQVVASLLRAMRAAGQAGAVRRLLDRDPVGQGGFEDPWEAAAMLAELRAAGEDDAVRRLLDRDPARLGKVDFADSVAWLLTELREAGAGEAIRTLLARDPASHVDLNDPQASLADPGGGAALLAGLRDAGEHEAARALLDRDPARQARLDRPQDVARLIAALRAAGAGEAAGTLARRAAGAGMFGVFLAYHSNGTDTGGAVSYRYGCEPDLTAAPPWRWAPPGPGTAGPGPAR